MPKQVIDLSDPTTPKGASLVSTITNTSGSLSGVKANEANSVSPPSASHLHDNLNDEEMIGESTRIATDNSSEAGDEMVDVSSPPSVDAFPSNSNSVENDLGNDRGMARKAPQQVFPSSLLDGKSYAEAAKTKPSQVDSNEDPKSRIPPAKFHLPGDEHFAVIEQVLETSGSFEEWERVVESARTEPLRDAVTYLTIPTGHTGIPRSTSSMKVYTEFMHDPGNETVKNHLRAGTICDFHRDNQSGDFFLGITSEGALDQLNNLIVVVMEKKYRLTPFNRAKNYFYIDVFQTCKPTIQLLCKIFHEHQLHPAFYEPRKNYSGCHSWHWRIYFKSKSCPQQLQVNNRICNQLWLKDTAYLVQGKGASYPRGVRGNSRSDDHIDLDTWSNQEENNPTSDMHSHNGDNESDGGSVSAEFTSGHTGSEGDSSSDASMSGNTESHGDSSTSGSTTGTSVATEVSNSTDSVPGANSLLPSSDSSSDVRNPSSFSEDTSSSSDLISSNSPEGSDQISHGDWRFVGNDPNTGVITRSKTNKRSNEDSITTPFASWSTSNYYAALDDMEIDIEECRESDCPAIYQVLPTKVRQKSKQRFSKEDTHFVEKRHTEIGKSLKPITLPQVAALLAKDIQQVQDALKERANPTFVVNTLSYMEKVDHQLSTAVDLDPVFRDIARTPTVYALSFAKALDPTNGMIRQLTHVHLIRRVVNSVRLNYDPTFSTTFEDLTHLPLPKSPAELMQLVQPSFNKLHAEDKLIQHETLAFFELVFFIYCPVFARSDLWIQYLTKKPVAWIPGNGYRSLLPSTLYSLLKSQVGHYCRAFLASCHQEYPYRQELERFSQQNFNAPDELILTLDLNSHNQLQVVEKLCHVSY